MKRTRRVLEPEEYLRRIHREHLDSKHPDGEKIVEKSQKGVSKAMQSLEKDFLRGAK